MSLERFLPEENSIVEKIERLNEKLKNSVVSYDIDGVDTDSATCAVNKFNNLFNTAYKVEDLTSIWGLTDWVKDFPEIENPREFAVNLWNSDDVFGNALPVSGAWILADYIEEEEIRPHKITSRPSFVEDVTRRWYHRWMPWIDQSRIHIQKNGREISPTFKVDKIIEIKSLYHFEDDPLQAEDIEEKTKSAELNTVIVIVRQPWNSGYRPKSSRIVIDARYTDLPPAIGAYLALADWVAQSY
ncbi:MAG: hypothetical protein AAB875_01160 [Patescibacteria group bacterium]